MFRGHYNSASLEKGEGSNSLLFSGFKLSTRLPNATGGETLIAANKVNSISTGVSTDPIAITGVPSNETGNVKNIFTFAELKKSYTVEYSQSYYKNLSINSLDGVFLPVSISGGSVSGTLSRYALNTGSIISGMQSRPFSSMPPLTVNIENEDHTVFDLKIHTIHLNPYTTSGILAASWDSGLCENSNQGFVIQRIAMGSGVSEFINGNNTVDASGQKDINRQAETDFRFNALRGPLVLQAWGYDTNGKPIPNANDSPVATESGIFRDNGLKDKFLKNWLSNPKTWPAAPIDLRFDRNRGVWVAPTQNKIVLARMKEAIGEFGQAEAELINLEAGDEGKEKAYYEHTNLWGPKGEDISEDVRNATVIVYDYIQLNLKKGDLVYLYYDDGKYIVMNQAVAGGGAVFAAKTLGAAGTGGTFKAELVDSSSNFEITNDTAKEVTVTDYLNKIPFSIPQDTPITISDIGEANSVLISIGVPKGSVGYNGSVFGLNFDDLPVTSEVPTYFLGMNGSNIVRYQGVTTCDSVLS